MEYPILDVQCCQFCSLSLLKYDLFLKSINMQIQLTLLFGVTRERERENIENLVIIILHILHLFKTVLQWHQMASTKASVALGTLAAR